MTVDVITIECLKCILLENVTYILQAEKYGIECDLDKYILKRDLAYSYLIISRTECELTPQFLDIIKKFTRLNCSECK